MTEKETRRKAIAVSRIAADDQAFDYFEAMSEPAFVFDVNGSIVFGNEQFAAMRGIERAQLPGCHVADLIDLERNVEFARYFATVTDGSGAQGANALIRVGVDDSQQRETALELSLTQFAVRGERLFACVGRSLHVVQESDKQQLLRAERLNEAQRIARIGNWEWDILSNSDWWSDELYRILEVEPDRQKPSFPFFLTLVHPQDRDRLQKETSETLEFDKPFGTDIRVILPSGARKNLYTQGVVHRDENGQPYKMTGTMQDVTLRIATESALRQSESRYRDAQRIAQIGNFEWDIEANTSWWSSELYNILEADPAAVEPLFENFVQRIHPDDRADVIAKKTGVSSLHQRAKPSRYRLLLPNGRAKVIEMLVEFRINDRDEPIRASGTIRDVTERHQLETRLRESEDRYSSTVELAAIGITHIDASGRFIWANKRLCSMLGYSLDELTGMSVAEVSHPDDAQMSDRDRLRLHAGEIDSMVIEKRYVRKDGISIWARITSTVRRDEHGDPAYDISIVEDVSDRRSAEQKIQYLATHDEMTGLCNRATFGELVTHAIETSRSHERQCAVLFIDLDRFKVVNDSLGHDAGDLLLKAMTARIERCIHAADVLARFGGDEFVVLLEEIDGRDAAERVAQCILAEVLHPLQVMGQEVRVTASIGIAMFPDDAEDVSSLMKRADSAMYQAKDEGKNNYQFYSPDSSPMSVENLILETQLGYALERDEFEIQYQTKVDVITGKIRGAEALLRWNNSELGSISPNRFIPIAEDTGMIVAIGKWVLEQACAQNVAWQREGLPQIVMSVNLSPRQFRDPGLLDDIADVLARTGMAPELLELEITEGMIMHNVEQAALRLHAIREMGVHVAIDDFGTGYSSLAQLKRFPIDTLKIDRSFIRDIPQNAEDEAITEAIISLGRTLGVTVIAEGVETQVQHEFLRTHGCDQMQGFYFARPGPADEFAKMLRAEADGQSDAE